ncbi:HAD hydrolase family protein [Streptomyces sp. NPDC029674]|uniref:HAD hydrolase family protein n=1 Tax=Streptomyces sp. NPDC029674 TaxID=3365297 RepID=UPI00384F12AF
MHIINFSFECGGFDNRLMRGGLSPLVWNLSREYAARGHRVSVITPAHGHLDRLRETFPIEELDYRADHVVPLVLDAKVWPDHPAEIAVELSTRAYRLRLDGVDVYFLSNAYLDLLPDRLYPPPGLEGRDLAHFKPLVFQVDGLRFLESDVLGGGPAVVHGFEPYYHYLLPPVLAADPLRRTVSTVAANAPVGQQVYRPQVERLLALLGTAPDAIGLDALDGPPPPEDSAVATMARALAGTRMHQESRPDHVGVFPLVAAHADLVDFVSPGQRAHCSTFEGTPFEALFATLPVARELRANPHKLLMGGCGVADSWLRRDPAAVDRAAVLSSLGLDPARPVFFHAARYAVHHKGQLELVRAMEEILADDRDISFVVRCSTGGGGEPAPAAANAYFQRVADRHPGQVYLDWRLADEDTLFEQAACADFCVYPSKYELDGFLIGQAEAMACGAVPIATAQRVTGHFGHARPLTDPEATGFSVRGSFRDDDPALARELTARIREAAALFRAAPATYARLSHNSRLLARDFTWSRSAELRLAAFDTVLRGERLTFPAEEAISYGWFDALDDTDVARHGDRIARAAADRGDAAAYARCAPLDAPAQERLFEAAWARADFPRCAALASLAARTDWTTRLTSRCRLTRHPRGAGWRVEYVHDAAERVELVVESAATSRTGAALESPSEAIASDEAVPTGSGATFLALEQDAAGTFHGTLPTGPPTGRELAVMVTLRSGRVAWDVVPVGEAAGAVAGGVVAVGVAAGSVAGSAGSVREVTRPTAGGTVPVGETAKPPAGDAIPVGETAEPNAGSAASVRETANPPAGDTIPLTETTGPTAASALSVRETARPTARSTVPVGETAKPPAGHAIPVGQMAEPTAGNAVSIRETARPPAGDTIPVVQTTRPTASNAASVPETARPPAEGNIPVRETTAPPYRLIATDLDGTLLRGDLSVSGRTRRALALASGAGARHLVVTGRPAAACRHFLDGIGYRGLAVCGQGAQLYDAGAGRLLEAVQLDLGLARSVVERVEGALGTVELGVVTAPPESRFKVTPRFGERVRHGWDVTADRARLWTGPIDKLVLHHPEVPEDELASVARTLCGDEVTVVHSVKGMVEVLPPGVTKGTGVARAARLMGFTGKDTIAFGDMPNDVPLLAWAGHGVAVANAHAELLAMADEIAPSNEEDGVAAVLERLFTPTPAAPRTSAHQGALS